MKKLQKNNLKELCRTCMKTLNKTICPTTKEKNQGVGDGQYQHLNTIPLHNNKTGEAITETILELLRIVQPKIIPELPEELPDCICERCVNDLLTTHSFLKTYKETEFKLLEIASASINVESELFNDNGPTVEAYKETELRLLEIASASIDIKSELINDNLPTVALSDALKEEEIDENADVEGEFLLGPTKGNENEIDYFEDKDVLGEVEDLLAEQKR